MTKTAAAPEPTPFPSATDTSDTAMLHGQIAQLQANLKLTTRNRDVFQKKYTETINQNLGLEERVMELEEELKLVQQLHASIPETTQA